MSWHMLLMRPRSLLGDSPRRSRWALTKHAVAFITISGSGKRPSGYHRASAGGRHRAFDAIDLFRFEGHQTRSARLNCSLSAAFTRPVLAASSDGVGLTSRSLRRWISTG